MNGTNLTREEYAANHPAGRIGKRLTVLVGDVMRSYNDCAICGPEEILINVIGKMTSKRTGSVLVCKPDRGLIGIFTDGDLRRAIERGGADVLKQPLGTLLKANPATCRIDEKAYDAMLEMERNDVGASKKRVKELPVVDDEKQVLGLLLLHDLVQYGL